MDDFAFRERKWLDATGLKKSKAWINTALRFIPNSGASLPGFDHTRVYYYPKYELHIIMTEPYHFFSEALDSLDRLAKYNNARYSYAVGIKRQSLWNPGYCYPLLVCREGEKYHVLLQALVAMLPVSIIETSGEK